VRNFVQSFCRALVELRAELRAGLPLSFVPQSSRKAPQLYAEGWRRGRGRGRKRSALVFTERLGGAVEWGLYDDEFLLTSRAYKELKIS